MDISTYYIVYYMSPIFINQEAITIICKSKFKGVLNAMLMCVFCTLKLKM